MSPFLRTSPKAPPARDTANEKTATFSDPHFGIVQPLFQSTISFWFSTVDPENLVPHHSLFNELTLRRHH